MNQAARFALAAGWLASSTSCFADGWPSERQEVEVRKVASAFGKCVVKAHHDRAAKAILANVDTATIIKRYADLIDGGCLVRVYGPGKMTFPVDLFRYALAEALVNADYGVQAEKDFSNRLPLAQPTLPPESEKIVALDRVKSSRERMETETRFAKQSTIAWMSIYGECIARAEPECARMWILTKPDVPEELSRIRALQSAFSACVTGGQLRFKRTVLRGAVAINYYRLAKATVQPQKVAL